MIHVNVFTAGRAMGVFVQSFSALVVFEYNDRLASQMWPQES